MQRVTQFTFAVVLTIFQPTTATQTSIPGQLATGIRVEDIQTVLHAPNGGADRQIRVVDIGKYNVSVAVLHRDKTVPGPPVGAINHERVTETYYILSGEGTLLTGGSVNDARPVAADSEIVKVAVGPSNNAIFREPAQSRKVKPGDVVIIPEGVYHVNRSPRLFIGALGSRSRIAARLRSSFAERVRRR